MNCKEIKSLIIRHSREVECLISEGYQEKATRLVSPYEIHSLLYHQNGNHMQVESNITTTALFKNRRLTKVISINREISE